MATLPIYDRSGAEVGKYEIDPAQLAPRISKQLLHDAVVMYQNNLRQGSAKTKTRAEVVGTSKKMYRQKGTGNARAGSRRSGFAAAADTSTPGSPATGPTGCRGRRSALPRGWPWPRASPTMKSR